MHRVTLCWWMKCAASHSLAQGSPADSRPPLGRGWATGRTRRRSTRRSTPRWVSSPRVATCAASRPAAMTLVPRIRSNHSRGRSIHRAEAGSVGGSTFADGSDKDGFQPAHTLHLRIRILDRTQYTSTVKKNDQGRKCCKVAGINNFTGRSAPQAIATVELIGQFLQVISY